MNKSILMITSVIIIFIALSGCTEQTDISESALNCESVLLTPKEIGNDFFYKLYSEPKLMKSGDKEQCTAQYASENPSAGGSGCTYSISVTKESSETFAKKEFSKRVERDGFYTQSSIQIGDETLTDLAYPGSSFTFRRGKYLADVSSYGCSDSQMSNNQVIAQAVDSKILIIS